LRRLLKKPTVIPATAPASNARYPKVRAFLLDSLCLNPVKAAPLFNESDFPLSERNLVLYLSTNALYHFCNTNTSHFAFDEYLFSLHVKLLAKFESDLALERLSHEEQEEQLREARGNIFCCERIENIAVMVVERFAEELERKLGKGISDFNEDLLLPLKWEIDEALMKIRIREPAGPLRDEIKLLDVKAIK
jgi:hypothetical protein